MLRTLTHPPLATMEKLFTDYSKFDNPPSLKLIWCILFCVLAFFYILTGQQGVSWQDSGMFQWRIVSGDFSGDLSLALAHPLYIALGRLFVFIPAGDSAAKLNYLSGIGMSVALSNLALLAIRLTGRLWIGLAITLMLSVTHTIWWLATITEVYAWHIAILTGELLLLTHLIRNPKWQTAVTLFFLSGLDWGIHNFALLPIPVYICVLLVLAAGKKLPVWAIPLAAAAYIAGAAPYIIMIIDLAVKSGDIPGALNSALFGGYVYNVLNIKAEWHFMKVNAGLAALNFANIMLPLAVIGWLKMRKRLGGFLAAALGAITVIEFLFVIRYSVPDQFMFLLPLLVLISISAAVGISFLADISKKWQTALIFASVLSIAIPPMVYANAPALLKLFDVDIKRERERPFRNEARYWLIPWKHNERSAEQFAAGALQQASPNGIIICDGTSYYPLLTVQRRDNLGSGVSILRPANIKSQCENAPMCLADMLQQRPMFVVSPAINFLPSDIMAAVELNRYRGDVLYSIKWVGGMSAR